VKATRSQASHPDKKTYLLRENTEWKYLSRLNREINPSLPFSKGQGGDIDGHYKLKFLNIPNKNL